MRVGILTASLEGGGAERQSAIWARLCAAHGHEVTAFELWESRHEVELPEVRVVAMPKSGVGDLAAIAWRLRRMQSELDALVVFEPYLAFCAALARLRIPWMVVTGKVPQQLTVGSRIPLSAYRWAFDRATHASAPNQAMVDAYRERGLRPEKSWQAVPNVAETEAFVASAERREGILFVGRLAAVKNPLLAVEAAAAVPAPLTVLGEGELQGEIEAALAARPDGPPVTLRSFTPEPWHEYARHRVLIVSSHFESFGNVIVESLAAGTPVVSVDCDFGPREIIGSANHSRLTEPTAAALSSALREVIERPYGIEEETECREIAERYRPEAVEPQILSAVERLGSRPADHEEKRAS